MTTERELVRFNTAGSVDNGKSTLIGRLLYDSGGLPDDVIAKIAQQSDQKGAAGINLAAFTDGLKAEREQGITIDASYRFFSRGQRDFIVADTPGHFEYTRNMMTAATHSDVTFILVDAPKGIVEQNRRHTYIASLLGVEHLVILINKMDSVGFSENVFNGLKQEFERYLQKLGRQDAHFIPISALNGDNVVLKSESMPWYKGPAIIEFLQNAEVKRNAPVRDLRFVVQWIDREARTRAGESEIVGQLVSGKLHKWDSLFSLPSERTARVRKIAVAGRLLNELSAPSNARLLLRNRSGLEPIVSRGSILSLGSRRPVLSNTIEAEICWMDQEPLVVARPYLLQNASRIGQASIEFVQHRVDIKSLEHVEGPQVLNQNDIASVRIRTQDLIPWDVFAYSKQTGSLILVDPESKRTVATGVVKRIV